MLLSNNVSVNQVHDLLIIVLRQVHKNNLFRSVFLAVACKYTKYILSHSDSKAHDPRSWIITNNLHHKLKKYSTAYFCS